MPRRPILLALLVAVLVTACVIVFVSATRPGTADDGTIAVGSRAPTITGTTLDGKPFDLGTLAGRPVVINFWGPSCVPCREEFPLLETKLSQHAGSGLAIVGVLMDDPPEPARQFVTDYHASWPTVEDPDKAARNAYKVAARPQSYFIDRNGVLRSIQVGELTDADFERQFAKISGGA